MFYHAKAVYDDGCMVLRATAYSLALALQEAMSSNDIRDGLQNAISAAHDGDAAHAGHYHGYVDHTGDENGGDVTFTCDPDQDGDCDYVKAPYSKGTSTSDDDYNIDTSKGKQVAMRTAWEDVPDEADHYAAMQEAKLYTAGGIPLCERFVSKKERDAAGSGDFAGKGKSFPILKAADVSAAASSLGRAGVGNYSSDVIKKNIIRIAKAKGFESELPKAWQDGGEKTKESGTSESGALRLVESAATLETIELREAKADYEIKLIAPGAGAMAYYPADVLKRDGPGAFPAETKVYANHPPKGASVSESTGNRDVYRLAGVLTTAAQYHESHAKGPGLYARVKVFADHTQLFEEKGKYLGMSVIANGRQAVEAGKPAVRDGLPVLGKITSGESVDVVSIAGAGGMILTEAATSRISTGGGELTTEEAQKLIEAAVKPFQARFLRDEARAEASGLLKTVSLPEAAKTRIIERAVATVPQTAEGGLDLTKFRESVVAEAKSEGEYIASLTGGGRVFGMGIAAAAPPKPEEIAAREAAKKTEEADAIAIFESLGMTKRAAEFAAKGRAA